MWLGEREQPAMFPRPCLLTLLSLFIADNLSSMVQPAVTLPPVDRRLRYEAVPNEYDFQTEPP